MSKAFRNELLKYHRTDIYENEEKRRAKRHLYDSRFGLHFPIIR